MPVAYFIGRQRISIVKNYFLQVHSSGCGRRFWHSRKKQCQLSRCQAAPPLSPARGPLPRKPHRIQGSWQFERSISRWTHAHQVRISSVFFAPEERRNVATGATRGRNRTGVFAPEGQRIPSPHPGRKPIMPIPSTGFTRGYNPAPLWGEKLAQSLT